MERKPDYRIFAWIAAGCFVLNEVVTVVGSALNLSIFGVWDYVSIVLVLSLAMALLLRNKVLVLAASAIMALYGTAWFFAGMFNVVINSYKIDFLYSLLSFVLDCLPHILTLLTLFSLIKSKVVKPLFFVLCALESIGFAYLAILNFSPGASFLIFLQVSLPTAGRVLAGLWIYLTTDAARRPKPVTRADGSVGISGENGYRPTDTVPPALMQNRNTPVTAAPVAPVTPVAPATAQPPQDNITLIKRYKELLDSGAITQEEYDAKKKQLLDL